MGLVHGIIKHSSSVMEGNNTQSRWPVSGCEPKIFWLPSSSV